MNRKISETSGGIMGYMEVFSSRDWKELDGIVDNIVMKNPEIFESPIQGDSRSEDVNLNVTRFIIRKNAQSTVINKKYSSKILNILSRANLVELIEQKTKLKNLNILRMQLNCMRKNSFVGTHTDGESDPAYKITALIRTTSSYTGGELYLYGTDPRTIQQPNHSIFFMGSNIEHEVKIVTDGYRNSLVVVLGK